jgi:hypothetical protein
LKKIFRFSSSGTPFKLHESHTVIAYGKFAEKTTCCSSEISKLPQRKHSEKKKIIKKRFPLQFTIKKMRALRATIGFDTAYYYEMDNTAKITRTKKNAYDAPIPYLRAHVG